MTAGRTYRTIAWTYLGILALAPITGLFWQTQWGWVKANWVSYSIILLAVPAAIRYCREKPRNFFLGLAVVIVYVATFFWNDGEWETMLRLAVALLPFFFLNPIRESISPIFFKKFWNIYLIILLIPVFISLLQLLGFWPYQDFGKPYDLYQGRISGGYQKPNNLNAFLFPAYLYGFYLFFKGDKWLGVLLSVAAFILVLVGGLRTSVIAYLLIFLMALVPHLSMSTILTCFRYGIFAFIGIGSFFLLSFARQTIGVQDGLRKRLPMWMMHSEYFFDSAPIEIVLGKGVVQLPEEARQYGVASLGEVHNNAFRIIITFGIVGFILYSIVWRSLVTKIHESPLSDRLRFLQLACVTHVLIYSLTNEPAFYPGVFWPLTAWIFFTTEPRIISRKE